MMEIASIASPAVITEKPQRFIAYARNRKWSNSSSTNSTLAAAAGSRLIMVISSFALKSNQHVLFQSAHTGQQKPNLTKVGRFALAMCGLGKRGTVTAV
jgi:hypothetical protein